jgi:hypothetical protein
LLSNQDDDDRNEKGHNDGGKQLLVGLSLTQNNRLPDEGGRLFF